MTRRQLAALVPALITTLVAPLLATPPPLDSGEPASIAPMAPTASTPATPQPPATGTAAPPRVLRTFDFEEARDAPLAFPHHFHRTVDVARGFPPFGDMALDDTIACTGDWSFRFDLQRGSLAARVPSGVLPVMPGVDYEISAAVRTADLIESRVVIAAWLVDEQGDRIDGTLAESAPLATRRRWQRLTIHVPGAERARDLLLDLRLLQPRQMGRDDELTPVREDFAGQAWFDDITVRQIPRVTIHARTPIVAGTPPSVDLTVIDVAAAELDAEIDVLDPWNREVDAQTLRVPTNGARTRIPLPPLPAGWHLLRCTLRDGDDVLRRTEIAVITTPQDDPRTTGAPILEVALPFGADRVPHLDTLIESLGVRGVIVTAWDERMNAMTVEDDTARIAALVDRMRGRYELTLAVAGVPRYLADDIDIAPDEVALALQPDIDHPGLDDLLVDFGRHVERWWLGVDATPETATDEHVAGVRSTLAAAVPAPRLLRPIDGNTHGAVRSVVFVDDRTDERTVFLRVASDAPTDTVTEVAAQALLAWRDGAQRLVIAAPWTDAGAPTPTAALWRGLSSVVPGRRFDGAAVLSGVDAWFVSDVDAAGDAESTLLLWPTSAAAGEFVANLGPADLRLHDLWGNVTTITRSETGHRIPLGPLPVLLTGWDRAHVQAAIGLASQPILGQ